MLGLNNRHMCLREPLHRLWYLSAEVRGQGCCTWPRIWEVFICSLELHIVSASGAKTHNVFKIERHYNKFIFTSFCIHNNTKSYFNIASLYSVPADWGAIFAEISIVKHVELIDAAAPVEARQCCVLSLWRNMRSLFENHLVTLEPQVEVEKTQE